MLAGWLCWVWVFGVCDARSTRRLLLSSSLPSSHPLGFARRDRPVGGVLLLGEVTYQKCTVLRPIGLSHMRLNHDSWGGAVLCHLLEPAWAFWRRAEVKNWALRNMGRDAR